MNVKELKTYLEFMDEHNLVELEIEVEGKRVKLKKDSQGAPYMVPQVMQQPVVQNQPAQQQEESNKREGLIEVNSPMVGTFYRAPSPGAKPYVDVGQQVVSGDVVCILEAMKLMNEIKAELGGTVVEILVQNGQTVEYDQPILKIKQG